MLRTGSGAPPDGASQEASLGLAEGLSPAAWVDFMLAQAVRLRASDVHLEPMRDQFLLRVRVDGMLRIIADQKLEAYEHVVARLKIMAQLNITERRKPQEGHILFSHPKEGAIDLRISFFPTVFGESVVLRILNRSDLVFEDVALLGMEPHDAARFAEVISRPWGMVLVTGPAGAGKTTTLYTTLNKLRAHERNIMTLEDPVELQLELVRQSQINPDIGYTFASGLKAILRQDPDIVMVGEIRDKETADIATRAALSGRLLFSTLHTTNTVGALVRFRELGVPHSFIASVLLCVVAQRLIRKVCEHCAVLGQPSEKLIASVKNMLPPAASFRKGAGCAECQHSGYLGRVGIFEILFVDKQIQQLILENASFADIERAARAKGMKLLREQAVAKAAQGVTSLEEALYTTPVE